MSGGCIVQVWPADCARAAWDREFLLVETELADLAEVLVALEEGSLVGGSRLLIRSGDERGEKVIFARRSIALSRAGVARIELPTWQFVDEDPEAA